MEGGLRLGPVGGRIVGEVFISDAGTKLDTDAAVCHGRRFPDHRFADVCGRRAAAQLASIGKV